MTSAWAAAGRRGTPAAPGPADGLVPGVMVFGRPNDASLAAAGFTDQGAFGSAGWRAASGTGAPSARASHTTTPPSTRSTST
jgi:hypothetical protein